MDLRKTSPSFLLIIIINLVSLARLRKYFLGKKFKFIHLWRDFFTFDYRLAAPPHMMLNISYNMNNNIDANAAAQFVFHQ